MPRDYAKELLETLAYAMSNGSRWLADSAQSMSDVIRARKKAVTAKDAYLFVTLMPITWFLQFAPLAELRNRPAPRVGELTPSMHQGFQLVYTLRTELVLKNGKRVAVAAYLHQKTLTPTTPKEQRPISVWQLELNYTSPDTQTLVSLQPVYFDTENARVVPGGVSFRQDKYEGSLLVTEKDVTVELSTPDGFAVHINATTEQGPVYLQGGSNITTTGYAQKLGWGVMDGAVGSARVWLDAAKTAPLESARGTLSLVYQQFGYNTISSFQQFLLACSTIKPHVPHHALIATIHLPSMHTSGLLNISSRQACEMLMNRKHAVTIEGALSTWKRGEEPQFDGQCRVRVSSFYPGGRVPASLHIGSKRTGHLFLDTLLAAAPSDASAHLNGYQSPMSVRHARHGEEMKNAPGAFAFVQWINGAIFPTPHEARRLLGISHSLSDVYAYNAQAVTVLVFSFLILVALLVAVLTFSRC